MEATSRYFEFVYTDEFVDSVEDLLDAEQLRALEAGLLTTPDAGRLIPGTGGVRKLRFALPGRGKSGGVRVLYVFVRQEERIYLLLAYAKNVRATLTRGERNALRRWVESL